VSRRGFTLIEVLVALVIVAVGVAAVLGALTSAANSTSYLRDKTFANWIALNRLTETRLAAAAPVDGKSDGVVDYAGRRWQWQQEIAQSQITGMKRIDVRVRLLDDSKPGVADQPISPTTSWAFQATGFAGTAIAQPSAALPVWEPAPASTPNGPNSPNSPNGPTPGAPAGNVN
jgi:general secretion pathway protein I